jgi:alpha-N-arabinofuranosidase
MDAFIREVVATADHVAAKHRHKRRLQVSFDEWNVWYEARLPAQLDRGWAEAPALIEDTYTATDAVVVGDLLITLIRHADRIGVACQAQLANVIGPIRTRTGGPAWRQSIFHPFALTARHAHGTVLRTEPVGPTYDTAKFGPVPVLDTVAVHDEASGDLVILVVNRGDTGLSLSLDLRDFTGLTPACHLSLGGGDSANTEHDPDRVMAVELPVRGLDGGRGTAVLPPISWNLIRFAAPHR